MLFINFHKILLDSRSRKIAIIALWLTTTGRRKRCTIIRRSETKNSNCKSHSKRSTNSTPWWSDKCTWFWIWEDSSGSSWHSYARKDSYLNCPQNVNNHKCRQDRSCGEWKSSSIWKTRRIAGEKWILLKYMQYAKSGEGFWQEQDKVDAINCPLFFHIVKCSRIESIMALYWKCNNVTLRICFSATRSMIPNLVYMELAYSLLICLFDW